jgi:ribosomal protein S18 acetylase RimI-like enzyme
MQVRRAKLSDLHAVGKLALGLVQLHESFDPDRFMHLPNADKGYERFLAREIENAEACVMVLTDGEGADEKIVGYTYSTMEDRDYNALLDACAKLHDIFVAPEVRGRRAGDLLLQKTLEELEKMGAPRIVLLASVKNDVAQHLFTRAGFRPTMLEMTRTTKKE